jgi:hypothetical protein
MGGPPSHNLRRFCPNTALTSVGDIAGFFVGVGRCGAIRSGILNM